MATPTHRTLYNIAGRWTLKKSLSDPFTPVLNLQGVNGFIRSIATHTSVTLPSPNPHPTKSTSSKPPPAPPSPPSPKTGSSIGHGATGTIPYSAR
ncbi:MAG: hypothetical protein L6R42_007270 [Xanthoria sp. 1 TBL-2021]|nr:MAG: hypothetical protein L6R42_007270 [Xanthoria sp. 1 TBL-2021]